MEPKKIKLEVKRIKRRSRTSRDTGVPGPQGGIGEKGDKPSQEELLSIIKPLIKEPTPGKDGKDGLDGSDGKDGRDGRDGVDGKNGKDAEPYTQDQVISFLKGKIKYEYINDAPNYAQISQASKTTSLVELDDVDLTGVTKVNGKYLLGSGGGSISLTTLGTSGVATLVGTVLNIPNYSTAPGGSTNNVQINNSGAFGGEANFTYGYGTTHTLTLTADIGSELVPALVSPNWNTLPAGWAYISGGIAHNANGQTIITPASMPVSAGGTYLVSVIIANITVASQITIGIGGNEYPFIFTTAGTKTFYMTAGTTGKLTIRSGLSTGRFEILGASAKLIAPSQAQVVADGEIFGQAFFARQAGAIVPQSQVTSGTQNNYNPGGRPALMSFNLPGNTTITGLDMGQANYPGYSIITYITNNSASAQLIIKNQDAGSTDVNRFQTWGGDLILTYKDVALCFYQPGQISRWSITKIASGASQWNGDFGTFLASVVVNGPIMTIGEGNAQIYLDDTVGKVRLGDAQNAANSNSVEVDDDNGVITTSFRNFVTVNALNSGYYVDFINNSTGVFGTDHRSITSRTLISDTQADTGIPNDCALFEVRSDGTFDSIFRGFLMPRGTTAQRDTIPSPQDSVMLYNNESRAFEYWDSTPNQFSKILGESGTQFFGSLNNGTNTQIFAINSLSIGYGVYLSGSNSNIFAITDLNDAIVYDFTGDSTGSLNISFGDIGGTTNNQYFNINQSSSTFNYFNGRVVTAASTSGYASLNFPAGTTPSSPVDGDIWFDGADLKMRVGGVTKTFTFSIINHMAYIIVGNECFKKIEKSEEKQWLNKMIKDQRDQKTRYQNSITTLQALISKVNAEIARLQALKDEIDII